MNENVNVCITPKGDKPVLHFSQFDNENVFTVTVLADDGETAAVLTGLDIEFRLRKTDSHVVTIAPESVSDNVITFKSTEQMCACCGQNIASVVLMKDDMIISTLDILVEIQRDILSGGLTSESDIRNLTTQIESIIPEVLDDDYYTKTEVDDLIADIPTFDPTNYYDKDDVDDLLADKADSDDVYTKGETDTLLADKADSDDVMSKVTRHGLGGDVSYFTFDNNCVAPMDNIECAVTAIQEGSGTPSQDNVRPITGHSSCIIIVADSDGTPVNTVTISFGQTVYGGVADVTNGKVKVTHVIVDLGTLDWINEDSALSGLARVNTVQVAPLGAKYLQIPICTQYEGVYSKGFNAFNNGEIAFSNSEALPMIRARSTEFAGKTNAQIKALMSGVMLCYELATPIEITTTPATTDTINGTNKVSSSTGKMKSLTYFSDVNSDLVDLIRACMI